MPNTAWWQVRDRNYDEEERHRAAAQKMADAIVGQDKWGLQARQKKAEAEGTTLFQERQPINAFQALGNVSEAWHSEFVEPAAGALAYPFSESVRKEFGKARQEGEPFIHALRTGKREGLQDMPWGAVGALELAADPLNLIPGIGFGGEIARGIQAGGRGLTRVTGEALARTPTIATGETGVAGALERASFAAQQKGVELISGRKIPMVAGGSGKPRVNPANKGKVREAGAKMTGDGGNITDPPSAMTEGAFQPPRHKEFVADMPKLEDLMKDIGSTNAKKMNIYVEDSVMSKANPMRMIDPSRFKSSPIARGVVAYNRMLVSSKDIIDVSIGAGIGAHAPGGFFGSGDIMKLMKIDKDGFVEGTGKFWNEVWSDDSLMLKYYNPSQRALVKDYRKIIAETEAQRVERGLSPLATDGGEAAKNGWFYIPRIGKGKVDPLTGSVVGFNRLTSAKKARKHKEIADAIANHGVQYEVDPIATLRLHMREALRDIANKELADIVKENSISFGKKAKSITTQKNKIKTKQERANASVNNIEAQLRPMRTVEDVDLKPVMRKKKRALEARLAKAKQRQNAANQEWQTFDENVYTAEIDRIKSARQTGARHIKASDMPGRTGEKMILAVKPEGRAARLFDKNILIEEQDAAILEKLFRNDPGAEAFNTFGKLANSIRFSSAVGDFALPFIQGLPVLGRNPKAWGLATVNHYKAFFNPAVQAKYMRDNLEVMLEMAENGVPVGDVEFFAAAREGGGFSLDMLYSRMPKGKEFESLVKGTTKQSVGRFQASYDAGLTTMRTELWKSLRNTFDNKQELGQYIRNMTGGLSSQALGVGPNQRAFESAFLAFSPRLLRSTIALTSKAINPTSWGTQGGREALRSVSGMLGVMALAYVTTGLMIGKSWDEIQSGLTPRPEKQREFLSHNVNGDWVGFGGQGRALLNWSSRVYSVLAPGGRPIEDAFKGGLMSNPLVQGWYYRGAPGTNIALGTGEFITNRDLLPFDDTRTVPDLLSHLGTSALPFALQGQLEGESVTSLPLGLIGLRTAQPAGAGLTQSRFQPAGFGGQKKVTPSKRY